MSSKNYINQNVLSHTGLLSLGPTEVPRTQVRFVLILKIQEINKHGTLAVWQ